MAEPVKAAGSLVGSIQEQADEYLAKAKKSKSGKLEFDANTPEAVRLVAIANKRHRDAQRELTKVTQSLAMLKAEKSELLKHTKKLSKVKLTKAQQEELDELKFEDPEAWREKLDEYESEARGKLEEGLNKKLKEASAESTKAVLAEQRKAILKQYKEDNPDFHIDEDVIENDVPPRLSKALNDPEADYKEALNNVREYLETGKVIDKGSDILAQPNLSKVGGRDKPSKDTVEVALETQYQKDVF